MSLSVKLRFSIFERDSFTCQYCGEKPPEVILHVDHIISRKNGGGDEEENLITSCRSCNLGKSSRSVDVKSLKKNPFKKKIAEMEERQAQLEAYYAFLRRKTEIEENEMDVFRAAWEDASDDTSTFTDKGLQNVRKLTTKYSSTMIFEAMKITWAASHVDRDSKFKYMCGVLKNMKQQQASLLRSDGE